MLQTLTERLYDDGDRTDLDPFAVFEEWLNRRDGRGFCFFTNFESAKGRQLLGQPKAAMLMHWKSLRRQVRVRGPVEVVSEAEADEYFASRARGSQIASSVSRQSRPLADRQTMMAEVEVLAQTLGTGPVPRPPHWSGFRIVPETIEFWKDGQFRLHDRVRFTRDGDGWQNERLYP
jgi:pyridoxamine 5'-phosphate oxidase